MDKETFIKFENSAKLELTEKEREAIYASIADSMKRFDSVLPSVNTDGVEPLVCVLPLENVMRADEAKKDFTRDELLKTAPETCDGCFVVPKTVE